MIYLKDLFRLQFHNLHLVAGAKGIDRTVTAAVLFEYDPSRMKLPDFYRGDLVVTTLAYAREDITLVSQSMLALLDQGVAGFLVKTAYFQELPQEVLERANQLHTPIFQFDNTYIEDVILRVTDLIRNKNPFIGYEDTLDSMIRGTFSPAQIRERMRQINPESSFAYGVLTIGKRKAHVSLEERFEHLLNENPNLKKRYIVMGWHGKLVAFCRLQEGEISSTEYAEDLLRCLRSQEGDYYVGISNPCLDPQKIGIFLCESVYAAQKAELEPQFCCTADGLGLYAFIMPLLQDDFAQQQAKKDDDVIDAEFEEN